MKFYLSEMNDQGWRLAWGDERTDRQRHSFFKKSDGWTREMMNKLVETLNGPVL